MNKNDPIQLLFGGLEKLGPAAEVVTLEALRSLPKDHYSTVVDAGCGTGQQTLVLAEELKTLVHAVDTNEEFLRHLNDRARVRGIDRFVRTLCLDMQDIPIQFPEIDLLWSEGAAYNIGFSNALVTWAHAVVPGGFAVVSELTWLRDDIPASVEQFFAREYSGMQTMDANLVAAEHAGYKTLRTQVLPDDAWVTGYYDILGARASSLKDHPDETVRVLAESTLEEIEIFRQSIGSYGYVLYSLERT
ncbi:MAG: hypothetical protein BMS9Abin05_2207 [Rhodothermia bacterium]|nr:MAG: hypothetical protein BMS9Abin05_2207 [Rhodothermia bacterium]